MTDWLSEIEEHINDEYDVDFGEPKFAVARMARVLREGFAILSSMYHHWENAGNAPVGYWIADIEDLSDDAKELLG